MTKQQVSDPSKGRYFLQMLNMSDDDLSPYQFRLLGHYIRVAAKTGKCWEGVRKTAQITQMSVGMVTKTRNELVTLGYIRVKHREDDTCVIVIVDRMAENIARYAHEAVADEADEFDAPTGKRSSGEQGVHTVREGVHHMNTLEGSSVHVVNERIQEPIVEPKKNKKILASVDAQVSNPFERTVADEADEYIPLPQGETQKSARAEKAKGTTNLSSRQGNRENATPTATTPQTPPIAARPPLSPDGKKPRSAKQLANDEAKKAAANALAQAMGIVLVKSDEIRCAQIASTLIASTIPSEEFNLYVRRLKQKAALEGGWTVTIESLLKNGRPSEYVTAREKSRQNGRTGVLVGSHVETMLDVSTNAPKPYNPSFDPAYTQESAT